MKPDSRIYIAGHTGLAGRAVVRRLQSAGYVNLLLRTRADLDLIDTAVVDRFYSEEQPEYVINCAARVGGIQANIDFPAEFLWQNLQIQNNLIWGAHKYGVEKFLFLGSSCVYPRECPQPMREEHLLTGSFEPTNEGYAIAKSAGIRLCEYIFRQYGKRFISCMPCNLYGPFDHFHPEYSHVHAGLMRRMHEAKIELRELVTVWGSGASRREFLHVDDLAEAVLQLMLHYDRPEFLNVGYGSDISIRELSELLRGITGFDGDLVFDTTKPDGIPRKLLDSSRMRATGWMPAISMTEGLQSLYGWFTDRQQRGALY